MIDFTGYRVEKNIILTGVRWYLAYPLSQRDLEERIDERGAPVDHPNRYRWVQTFTSQLEATFRNGKKRSVDNSWRMDKINIKMQDQWQYRYCTVDKARQMIALPRIAIKHIQQGRPFLSRSGRPTFTIAPKAVIKTRC